MLFRAATLTAVHEMYSGHPVRKCLVEYLYKRVSSGFSNAMAIGTHSMEASSDIGSINRGAFEAAVNFLFVTGDQTNGRIAAFWLFAAQEEIKRNNQVAEWKTCADPIIKKLALREYQDLGSEEDHKKTILPSLGVQEEDLKRWPSLEQRTKVIGDMWAYLYDSHYRALSTWQHGDTSRLIVTDTFVETLGGYPDRTDYETFVMVSWAFDILANFCISITNLEPQRHAQALIRENYASITTLVASLTKDHQQRMRHVAEKLSN